MPVTPVSSQSPHAAALHAAQASPLQRAQEEGAAAPAGGASALSGRGLDAPSFEKKGKLADLNIDAFLDQYSDANYKRIRPDNPAYFLVPVRNNRKIKESLRDLSRNLHEIEQLCAHVDRGDWEAIEPTPRNKDAIFYAYAANRISREEFKMQRTAWNVQEQFQGKVSPVYQGRGFGRSMAMPLPQRLEKCDLLKLFDEDGKLSNEAEEYLEQFADNMEAHVGNHLGRPFDRNRFMNEMEAAFREIPENLQVFYCISNSFTEEQRASMRTGVQGGRVFARDPNVISQLQLSASQMPWAAAPDEEGINDCFFNPSPAMFMKFLRWLNPDFVQPVPCLGAVSDDSVGAAALKGFHQVRTCDDRVLSNHLTPHGYPMGVLDGEMHDLYHCMAATLHSREQRMLSCQIFPDIIRSVMHSIQDGTAEYTSACSEQGKKKMIEFAESMKNHLMDMANTTPSGQQGPDFLMRAARLAARDCPEMVGNQVGQALSRAFLRDCGNRAKQCRTGHPVLRTFEQKYDWTQFDNSTNH